MADDSFQTLTDLDRAVDTLIEMKNVSEAAVGLAYSALSLQDSSLANEVIDLEGRLDAMKESLEVWVLRAAKETLDPSPLRSLLHLAEAAEDIGDQARQMVWIIAEQEDLHPVLALALGDADEVVVRLPVAAGSQADRLSLGNLDIGVEPGFHVLTIRRDSKYIHRPPRYTKLRAGDEVIAVGPEEGQEALARMLGWSLEQDEDTGELQLRPLVPTR
jgi:uncharacterized protein with PhoU and TrkA domain